MAKTLSTIITNRVKALNFDRYDLVSPCRRSFLFEKAQLNLHSLSRPSYKIVTLVTVGEAADQGVQVVRLGLVISRKGGRNASAFPPVSLIPLSLSFAGEPVPL
jgi:hypothetical protein